MGTAISFTINKGGVGKTTSLCAIAQILALGGYKVLIADLGQQSNASRIFGIREDLPNIAYKNLYCKLLTKEEMQEFIIPTSFENIDIIPSSTQLIRMNDKIYDAKKENPAVVTNLKNNLQQIKDDYDFILIDNEPTIDNMLDCSIAASDKILIPMNTDNLSYEGILNIIKLVEKINNTYNLQVKFGGIFITRVKKRTTLYRDLSEGYTEQFGDYFIPVAIRDCNAVAEANTAFIPLYEYEKKCTAFIDYIELISHLNIMDQKHYQNVIKKLSAKKI